LRRAAVAIVPATKFKAQCLELMDRVAERRATYVITKRGKPVAKLVPADPPERKSVFGCMADQTEFVGDLDQPAWSAEEWKRFERERRAQATAWEKEWRTSGTISGKKTVGQPPHLARRRAVRSRPGRRRSR
jgi:prevent-host-death family protein